METTLGVTTQLACAQPMGTGCIATTREYRKISAKRKFSRNNAPTCKRQRTSSSTKDPLAARVRQVDRVSRKCHYRQILPTTRGLAVKASHIRGLPTLKLHFRRRQRRRRRHRRRLKTRLLHQLRERTLQRTHQNPLWSRHLGRRIIFSQQRLPDLRLKPHTT